MTFDNLDRSFFAPPAIGVHNGLCECRGPMDRHPFHGSYASRPIFWTTTTVTLDDGYVGKHRKPE